MPELAANQATVTATDSVDDDRSIDHGERWLGEEGAEYTLIEGNANYIEGALAYEDIDLPRGHTYRLRLGAFDNLGQSTWSPDSDPLAVP